MEKSLEVCMKDLMAVIHQLIENYYLVYMIKLVVVVVFENFVDFFDVAEDFVYVQIVVVFVDA